MLVWHQLLTLPHANVVKEESKLLTDYCVCVHTVACQMMHYPLAFLNYDCNLKCIVSGFIVTEKHRIVLNYCIEALA